MSTESSIKFSVSVDGKGRIVLPVEIRKTLGIGKGTALELSLSVSEGKVEIKRGDSNV